MDNVVRFQLLGPFELYDDRKDTKRKRLRLPAYVNDGPGVYLWTVPVSCTNYVHDIGQSKSLRRWIQHDRGCLLNGLYWFHDPERLTHGDLLPVYDPNCGQDRHRLSHDEPLRALLESYAALLRLFIAYVPGDSARLRHRLEAELAENLKHGRYGSLLWGDWKQADLRRPDEEPITAMISSPSPIAGLPETLII